MSFEFRSNPAGALEDFRRARRRAALQEVVSQLKGESADLLSYEDVHRKLRGQEDSLRELKDIPINSIVGSVGRYKDFNRSFLPRGGIRSERWARVKMAMTGLTGVPPIEVYQIGEVYFVKDGNHRVSVAREMNFSYIQAYVTSVRTKVPLSPDVSLDQLILKAEYVEFLEQTRIDELRPGADLSVTAPGACPVLLEHIEVHRYFMGIDENREIAYEEAVTHWYDCVYWPVIDIIRRRALLQDFTKRTETDLYLYISQHQAELEHTLGWEISTDTAAGDIRPRSDSYRPTSERARALFAPRATSEQQAVDTPDRLFGDILVAINGRDNGWNSFDQASLIARREGGARLHGLHVVSKESERREPRIAELQSVFSERCRALDLSGRLAIDSGERINRICRRARYTDLTVVCLKCSLEEKKFGEGVRNLLRNCPRPVLVVPPVGSPLDRVLLAYDGSDLAKEALYIGAYMANRWGVELTVLTVNDDHVSAAKTQQRARNYLESHRIEADYIKSKRKLVKAILGTAKERRSNLILMGAYGLNAPIYITVGSAVEPILQASNQPVLICR
ncbi:universal stress protein [Pseudomaricurvus alcaniphilus]|uniref:universal stress protein n=1 Tax=Pseudomaricurvus alcaniphilus TaxID=1166482 RepID=UPI00140C69BB|nr:universal stress protein [Pseudomaricurvus alcaniphilus]NHN36375.1 universal stress protein [Pseudomaricurvus alcaniphilus]